MRHEDAPPSPERILRTGLLFAGAHYVYLAVVALLLGLPLMTCGIFGALAVGLLLRNEIVRVWCVPIASVLMMGGSLIGTLSAGTPTFLLLAAGMSVPPVLLVFGSPSPQRHRVGVVSSVVVIAGSALFLTLGRAGMIK